MYLYFTGLDELDEFNEAPHIVHGDVTLRNDVHISSAPPNEVDIHNRHHQINHNHMNINNSEITADLLDDDDEDVVLSTDDLLISGVSYKNNSHNNFAITNNSNNRGRQTQNNLLTEPGDVNKRNSLSNSVNA